VGFFVAIDRKLPFSKCVPDFLLHSSFPPALLDFYLRISLSPPAQFLAAASLSSFRDKSAVALDQIGIFFPGVGLLTLAVLLGFFSPTKTTLFRPF